MKRISLLGKRPPWEKSSRNFLRGGGIPPWSSDLVGPGRGPGPPGSRLLAGVSTDHGVHVERWADWRFAFTAYAHSRKLGDALTAQAHNDAPTETVQKFSNFCNTFDLGNLFEVAHTFDNLFKVAVREYKLILNNEELVNFVIEDPTRHSTLCRVLITCRNMNKCVGLLPTTERF